MIGSGAPARLNRVAAGLAMAGLVLAVSGAAGCSSQPATSQPSVEACTQFAIAAIKNHVTVTALPSACQGLTPAQIDSAASTALRSADDGVRNKALKRQRIVAASRFIERMFVAVPAQRSEPLASSPAAGWISRTALSVAALSAQVGTSAASCWRGARCGWVSASSL